MHKKPVHTIPTHMYVGITVYKERKRERKKHITGLIIPSLLLLPSLESVSTSFCCWSKKKEMMMMTMIGEIREGLHWLCESDFAASVCECVHFVCMSVLLKKLMFSYFTIHRDFAGDRDGLLVVEEVEEGRKEVKECLCVVVCVQFPSHHRSSVPLEIEQMQKLFFSSANFITCAFVF